MKTVILALFCTLVYGGSKPSSQAFGQDFDETIQDVKGGPSERFLQVGDITIQESLDKAATYQDERERQHQAGSEAYASVSPSGASYAAHGKDRLSAEDYRKLRESSKYDADVRAGKDVRYQRANQKATEEDERRQIAAAREYYSSGHTGVGTHHSASSGASSAHDHHKLQAERDRTKWSAGREVSITQDRTQLSEDDLRRREQQLRQSHTDTTADGILTSGSDQLSQEELQKRLRRLKETKDLRAGEARLVHKKQGAQDFESSSDRRDAKYSGGYAGRGGISSHHLDAHSGHQGRKDVRGQEEELELTAGSRLKLNEKTQSGSYDKYGQDDRRVTDSKAVVDSESGRLTHVKTHGKSGSEVSISKHGSAADHRILLGK